MAGKRVTAVCPACSWVWRVSQGAATRCPCGTRTAPDRWGQKYSVSRRRGRVVIVFAAKTVKKVVKVY